MARYKGFPAMHDVPHKKIIIEGITESGEHFRPADWAERMSGNLCTLRNRRVVYSPLLQPGVKDGYKCIIIDPQLKEEDRGMYDSILEFAHVNKLRICYED